jgi:thiamine transport system permease protein
MKLATIAALLVLALIIGPILAVAMVADWPWTALTRYDLGIIWFTVLQAGLSAFTSLILGILLARALARRQFRGRLTLITLLGAPFILPTIVAILGLIMVFGRNGPINSLLSTFGLEAIEIYGLGGIILAHVFFNLPLATRLILQGWQSVPSEHYKLASSLHLSPFQVWRHIERPMLARISFGTFLVIFLVCLTSFSVVLALGGGPKSTTIELAIYQAFRFDFNLGRAAQMALVQLSIGVAFTILSLSLSGKEVANRGYGDLATRWENGGNFIKILDICVIGIAALFLLTPLIYVVVWGITGISDLQNSVFTAAGRSILVALLSVIICITLAIPMALAIAQLSTWINLVGMLPIASSGLVLGIGLFILLNPIVNPAYLALPLTALVNALLGLPFVLRAILPSITQTSLRFRQLSGNLGLNSWQQLRLIQWPRSRSSLGFASGLMAAMSMGDLGVITLFSNPDTVTLPLQVYQLMGAYKMDQAAAAALILLVLSMTLFWTFDQLGGRDDPSS